MHPLFMDVGWVGSPADVATFVLVLSMYVYRFVPRQATLAAAVVALSQLHTPVDDERLQDELDVDDQEVDALRPTIVCGGEARDD